MSVLSRENKKDVMNELHQESAKDMEELSVDALQDAVGAGDPYEKLVKQSRVVQKTSVDAGEDKPIVLPELP